MKINNQKAQYVAPYMRISGVGLTHGMLVHSQFADIEDGDNNFYDDGVNGETENVETDDSWNDLFTPGYN